MLNVFWVAYKGQWTERLFLSKIQHPFLNSVMLAAFEQNPICTLTTYNYGIFPIIFYGNIRVHSDEVFFMGPDISKYRLI